MRLRTVVCWSLVAVSLAGALAVAAPASAKWSKAITTPVSFSMANPTWKIGNVTWTCNIGTFTGIVATATSLSGNLTFQGTCGAGGVTGTVTCTGTFTIAVSNSAKTLSKIILDAGSSCTLTVVALCAITVAGLQSPPETGSLDETTTMLTLTHSFSYTRTGSALCAPASGTGTFSGSWVTPVDLDIDP